jgi:hypothetical protein
LPFSDDITKDYDCEGFLFHNVNGIKNEHNWFQILSTMKDLNITFFGLAEMNTTMHGYFFHKWNEHVRKVFRVSKTEALESDIKFDSEYKPGGTFSAIVDKWQARVTEKGSDNSGLGRWNYITISSNNKKLAVITAYKPCKTDGPTTAWTQQWILLRENQKDPDPGKEFCKDLNELLHQWRSKDYEIILMINANEEIGASPGGLGQILAKNGLYDIIANQHDAEEYSNTYIRGSKRIDYIFGTKSILQHCQSSGLLPFCYGYPSNHRAVFIRINMSALMSSQIHATESTAS